MITDVNFKSRIRGLNTSKLPSYWSGYFDFEKDTELSELTKNELIRKINLLKKEKKPFIDSQIIIANLLTTFGNKHIFHRKFNERFPYLHKEQILGMQLYKIMVEDSVEWIYCENHPRGHVFSHATYFKAENRTTI